MSTLRGILWLSLLVTAATTLGMAQSLIPQNGWSVLYVDSQETACFNGVATNAFDNKPGTFWVTRFCGATTPTPHEIQIDLGSYYNLSAFQYLPRQDGCSNGWINQYEFYLSTDGVNWGSPAAAGSFNYAGYAAKCPGGGTPPAFVIGFSATVARYVRLRALSEVSGNPWTAVAEINLAGTLSSIQPAGVAQLTLSPGTILAGSFTSATVSLGSPAPAGGAVVTLGNSNAGAVTMPASVVIPAGATSAEFLIGSQLGPSSSLSINATYGGSTQAATLNIISGTPVPQSGWSVLYVDSQETTCYNGAATNAFDGNPASMWVTTFCGSTPPTPHEIQINLGASYNLAAFRLLERQDGCSNGWIKQYAFYVSSDGIDWGTPVASGTFNYGNIQATCPGAGAPPAIEVAFPPATGQYIRLRALSEINGNPWTTVAELNVLSVQLGPLALTLNPTTVVGGNAATGTLTLNGPAPVGGISVALSSVNPALATVPTSILIPEGSISGSFPVSTTAVNASTTVDIIASYGGVTQGATLALSPPTLIPRPGWSVIYADSQETACYNGAATNAIDGNASTLWVSQFCGTTAPMPHEIQVDLGAAYTLSAFQYLPRQDGCSNGWIKQYEFYVSSDGKNWGTPRAAGNFDYTGYATTCPGAGKPPAFTVAFPTLAARYVRLRALSEVNGNPWAAVAEFSVLGDLQAGLLLSVSGLDFPDQLLGTASAPLPVALTNFGLTPVAIGGISSFGDFVQTNNCGSSLSALVSCSINVTFTPSVAGYRTARLTVQNTASGFLEIPLSGNGVNPAVTITPASAAFGAQLLNTTGTAPSIDLLNVGNGPLLVSSIAVTGDFSQSNNCAGPIAPTDLCTIQVFFTPTATGSRSGALTVVDNTAAGKHVINMSGTGVNKHNVNLSWTASTSQVVGYYVYRATQSGGPYTELSLVPSTQTAFVDSLPGGATYYYVVTALNSSQIESVTSPEVTAVIPAP